MKVFTILAITILICVCISADQTIKPSKKVNSNNITPKDNQIVLAQIAPANKEVLKNKGSNLNDKDKIAVAIKATDDEDEDEDDYEDDYDDDDDDDDDDDYDDYFDDDDEEEEEEEHNRISIFHFRDDDFEEEEEEENFGGKLKLSLLLMILPLIYWFNQDFEHDNGFNPRAKLLKIEIS